MGKPVRLILDLVFLKTYAYKIGQRRDCVGAEIELPTQQKILDRVPIHNSHKVYQK